MELHNRFNHTYIIGATGAGKSTLLKHIILTDIHNGDGVFFIDPHGHDCNDIIGRIPAHRRSDVIVFDPSDYDFPIPWNPLQGVSDEACPFVSSTIVDTIKDAWGYSGVTTPTLDQYLFNTTFALIQAKQPLLGMKFMLTRASYRTRVLESVFDPIILDFWLNDFEDMSQKDKRDTTRSTLNKIGALVSDARIRNILGQTSSAFQFAQIIDNRKIFLARLPQGKLGLQKTKLIGSLLLTQLHLALLSRTTTTPFHVHIDEVHHFAGSTLAEMLSGVRKFNASLTIVHQYLDQLSRPVQASVLGNVGTKILFRVSRKDAEQLNDLMGTNNLLSELHVLPRFHARIVESEKIDERMIDVELPPYDSETAVKIIAATRRHFAKDRMKVEGYIRRFIERA